MDAGRLEKRIILSDSAVHEQPADIAYYLTFHFYKLSI
jgi:hypothetical protein